MSYSFSIFLKDFASSPMAKIASGVGNLQNKVDSFSSKTVTATSEAGKGFDSLSGKVDKTEKEITELGSSSAGTNGKLNGLVGVASRLFLAFASFETVKALFNVGVQAEQANVKFEVLLGSAEKANKMIRDLTTYADLTPYSFEGLQKGAETMLGFGIAEEKIIPSMKMIGDVAMGNDEKLSGLSLVYSQIMATGKLMGQDLMQLINQGFNPLQIISEETGLSMGVLKEQMEKGAISSDMVSEAFRIATSEGGRYYGMTEKMSQSAGGKWSTMMDTFAGVTRKIGLRFAEWVKPLFDVGTSFAENIIPFGKWLIQFLPSMETFTTILYILGITALAVGGYLLVANASTIAWSISLGILNGIIWLVEAAQWAWNLAMSLNPVGIVIAAIIALIGVIVLLWNRFGWFRGAVLGTWEVLKGFATMIKNYVINRLTELLTGITGIGRALAAFFRGDFQQAWDIGKKAAGDLLGGNAATKAVEDGKKAFQAFGKGYNDGVANFTPKTVQSVAKTTEKTEATKPKSKLFDSLLGAEVDKEGKKKKGKLGSIKDKSDGIVSGGSKQTTITVNIEKVGTDTKIYVDSAAKGISNLGEKVQEELLRAINSINQMQTA